MAFRYGGEVKTKSIEPGAILRRRASPCLTTDTGPTRVPFLWGQLETTVSTAERNLENGLTGARSNSLCGRLWDRSIANDAPELLVMMSRENPHQSTSRITSS